MLSHTATISSMIFKEIRKGWNKGRRGGEKRERDGWLLFGRSGKTQEKIHLNIKNKWDFFRTAVSYPYSIGFYHTLT